MLFLEYMVGESGRLRGGCLDYGISWGRFEVVWLLPGERNTRSSEMDSTGLPQLRSVG